MPSSDDTEVREISWYIKPYKQEIEELKLDKKTTEKLVSLLEEVFADGIIAGHKDEQIFETAAEYLDKLFQN